MNSQAVNYVRIAMTPKDIMAAVAKKADTRMDETVGRLMDILRVRHTHECWHKECECEYCRFINGDYVDHKLRMHRLKKLINRLDFYWDLTDTEAELLPKLGMDMLHMKCALKDLKEHKKLLQTKIL